MARILIVDDSGLSRKTSRRILEAGGHQVVEATDGFLAIERFAVDKPDLVLLDITMAEMDGLEVLQQLKAIDPTARVVMATADVQSTTRALAMTHGAAGFVTKPFTSDTVLAAVQSALEGIPS